MRKKFLSNISSFSTLVLLAINLLFTFHLVRSLSKRTPALKNSPLSDDEQVTSSLEKQYDKGPPLTMNPQRLHYQYACVLPQVYLTLISVLQGGVFAVFIANIPLPTSASWAALIYFLEKEYFYLPYVISALTILIIWNQFVNAILFLVWPFTVTQSLMIFLLTLAQILTFNHIASFYIWLVGMSCIGILGAWIRINNIRFIWKKSMNWVPPLDENTNLSKNAQLRDGIIYIVASVVLPMIFSLWEGIYNVKGDFHVDPSVIHLSAYILIFLILCLILFLDKTFRKIFLYNVIKNSNLTLTSEGILSYKILDRQNL